MSSTTEIMRETVDVLSQHDYNIYTNINSEIEMCFELIAEHNVPSNPNLIIKIIENIDNIKPQFVHELKIIANLLEAIPILLGFKNRHTNLEDNVIYNRDNLVAINIHTFHNVVSTPALPMAIAKQGGFFIDIDGNKMQQLREKNSISRQDLADQLQITSKAVAQYERNEMRSSVEHAKSIEKVLGESIVIPISFFDAIKNKTPRVEVHDNLQRKVTAKNRDFIHEINEYVFDAGFKTFWTGSAPFDLFIYEENEGTREVNNISLVGGIQSEKESLSSVKYNLQIKFLQRVPQPGALILDEELMDQGIRDSIAVPYLIPKELKLLEKPKEFQSLIRKRNRNSKPIFH